MNKITSIIALLILLLSSITHPAHADAQQKFSFQGVSYNGDIKPEQFQFSDVMIKASSYSKKSVKIKITFNNTATSFMPKNTEETANIFFIGDPNNKEIYAIQLRKDTFCQTRPKKCSYEGKYDNFLIAPKSIQDGSFNSLYEQLTNDHKVKLKGACHYFKNDL